MTMMAPLCCSIVLLVVWNIALVESFSPLHYRRASLPSRFFSSSASSSQDTSPSLSDSNNAESLITTSPPKEIPQELNEKQLDFFLGYLNKHHGDLLVSFAAAFSSLGREQFQRNSFSGGSYKIASAKIVDLNTNELTLQVTVDIRGQKEPQEETVKVELDAEPISTRRYSSLPLVEPVATIPAVDLIVRKLNRLCWMTKKHADVTGKLIQVGIQIGENDTGFLKENLYLNQVPHNRYVRRYFYDMAAQAALDACILCSTDSAVSNRMKMISMFPEMNPSMDSYRIGTLLELVRTVAIRLAEENLRVRICVQGSMGVGIFTGVPKQLNGVATLLRRMDWQSEPGEENQGMVGDYVNFGAIGKEHVVNESVDKDGNIIPQDDVFIILAPQSMVGIESSIIGPLSEMVDAAGDRPVILINPDLTDKISSQGQQSVRGRKERMEFADSFETIFHFQNIYVSGTSYFPILGAITKRNPKEPWVAHQRRDRLNEQGEVYVPVLSSEEMPSGEAILDAFER